MMMAMIVEYGVTTLPMQGIDGHSLVEWSCLEDESIRPEDDIGHGDWLVSEEDDMSFQKARRS